MMDSKKVMGFFQTLLQGFTSIDINGVSIFYIIVGALLPSAVGTIGSPAIGGEKNVWLWVVARTVLLAYLAERFVYFSQPEFVFPFTGAMTLLVVLWVASACLCRADNLFVGSQRNSDQWAVADVLAACLALCLCLASGMVYVGQWDALPGVSQITSGMIGNVTVKERSFDENGFPVQAAALPTEMDQSRFHLVSDDHANFIAYTSYAKLPSASRLLIDGAPALSDYRYYFSLSPQGPFAQKYLQRVGVPYIVTSSLTPNSDGEVVPATVRYGHNWLYDHNSRRIAWRHDPFARFVKRVFYVDPADPLHPQEWYMRGYAKTGWRNVVIDHATVVDSTTGAVKTVQRADFPKTLRQVLPRFMAQSRFDGWGTFRFGFGYQWITGPRIDMYHVTSASQISEVWGKDGDLYFQLPVQLRNTTSGSNLGYVLYNERTEEATFYREPSAGVDKLDNIILSDIQKANVDLSIGKTSRVDLFDGLIHGFLTVVEIPDQHGARYKSVAICESGARKCGVAEKPEEAIASLRAQLVQDEQGWQPFFATRKTELLTLSKKIVLGKNWVAETEELPGRYLHGNVDSLGYDVLFADSGAKLKVQYLDTGATLETETMTLVK